MLLYTSISDLLNVFNVTHIVELLNSKARNFMMQSLGSVDI